MISPFNLHANDRVVVLIDGLATFSAHKSLGFDLDYRALFAHLRASSRVRSISYYNLIPEGESPVLQRLLDWMEFNGVRTVVKALRFEVDRRGRMRERSTLKVELAVDMLRAVTRPDPEMNADTVILFAADPDLLHAVETVQQMGAKVVICGAKENAEIVVDEALRRTADMFVDIGSLRTAFAMHRRP